MPPMQLPFFPDGVEHITSELGFEKRDGQVIYFNGHIPVFIHAEEDTASFRMITAQFCINGNAKQAEISGQKRDLDTTLSTKSQRSGEDAQALMAVGTSNVLDRVAASVGGAHGRRAGISSGFECSPWGPAPDPAGAVGGRSAASGSPILPVTHGLLWVREPFLAGLPGPGTAALAGAAALLRTVRKKLAVLSDQQQASSWSAERCAHWMGEDPDQAAVLYVDGDVRVYHGHQTELPRHYVARQKLCLRATTDYWIHAMDGQPFFVLNQAVDPGMLQVLEGEIVPRLEKEIPNQPTAEELQADAKLHRFTVIFDREGYSPAFFRTMKDKHIACLTYHKYPGEDWPQEEFFPCSVHLASGACVERHLPGR
jgi:hypothetical protein